MTRKKEYIRGWRQVTAIYFALWSLFTGNWLSLKRELHIISGFAKPYNIVFAPSFWESCKQILGWSDEEIQILKGDVAQKYGTESIEEDKEVSTSTDG